MSERKVLNKYYPPEFDPSKIPKLRIKRTGVFSIRIMAPFNMRCNTCGEYIYKGKKFNSRKENVDDDDYLGLRIFRFYIRCPRCIAEIAFKTDLANTDYTLEAGATRLFEAEKLAHQMAEKERKEKEEDELNPMKMLENRTKASRNEMEQLDQLEELREMNARNAKVDHQAMIQEHLSYQQHLLRLEEEQEDMLVKAILRKGSNSSGGTVIKRVKDEDEEDGDLETRDTTSTKKMKPNDTGTASSSQSSLSVSQDPVKNKKEIKKESWQRSVGSFSSSKAALSGLVKKKTNSTSTTSSSASSPQNSLSSVVNSQTNASVGKSSKEPSSSVAGSSQTNGSVKEPNGSGSTTAAASGAGTGLSLLGDYSDSDDSN